MSAKLTSASEALSTSEIFKGNLVYTQQKITSLNPRVPNGTRVPQQTQIRISEPKILFKANQVESIFFF